MRSHPSRWWMVLGFSLLACGSPSHPRALADAEADTGVDVAFDAVPQDEDASAEAEPSETELLFDDFAPPVHFDIELSTEDLDWLNEDPTREEYVRGAVVVDGERFEDVGVRYKGAYGSLISCVGEQGELLCSKLALKLSFNKYDRSGRFRGLRKVILHACNRDVTCLRERLAYRLFRAAGIAAPRVVHATASINGEPPSLYAMVEYVDHEFVEDSFTETDGNLYKEVWPRSDNPEVYRAALRTNEDVGDVSRLVEFARVLSRTSDQSFAGDVEPWIDLDAMARYNAVDQLLNNWDGLWKFYCAEGECGNHNFYLYDDPASGRFVVIPWDLDYTWRFPNDDMARSWWDDGPTACEIVPEPGFPEFELGTLAPQCDPLMRGLMRSGWEAYRDALRDLLDGPETGLDGLLTRLNRYRATLREFVANDPHGPTVEAWDAAVAQLRQILIAQAAEAERFLAE